MPAAISIIPIVTRFHWDDLTNLFELKITFELKSPLGVFRKEERFSLGDLASVVAAIYSILTAAHSDPTLYTLGYPVGDWATVTTLAAEHAPPTLALPVLPVPVPADPADMVPFVLWDGLTGVDHPWGVT